MKKRHFVYITFSLIIAFGACKDPVFYMISVEPPLVEPLIGGSPSNFTVFNNEVYVASGRRIFSYDGNKWKPISSQPGGRIVQLAATDSYLYALCFQNSERNRNIKRFSGAGNWEDVTGDTGGYDTLQSVYAANDKVFIGAERVGNFIILYMADNDDGYIPLTPGGTNDMPEFLLCGIAYDSAYYYLCTRGNAIFATPIADIPVEFPKTVLDDSFTFTGIINLGINDIIVAISRNGKLYNVSVDAGVTIIEDISIGNSRYSTGALAVWRDETGTPRLLLAGRQDSLVYTVDSGYTYGFMELELDLNEINGIKAGSNFIEPGKADVSSVADHGYERYVSTLGKNPVNHIFQTPKSIDENMTLFASTQKNGVWSYKVRGSDTTPQWNAEE